jgi:hypothetical protein
VRFSNSATIQRSPKDVFNFLAELENVPQWNHAIVETHETSAGPLWRVGTSYRKVRSLPSRSDEAFQVTEFHPYRRLAIRGDLGPPYGPPAYDEGEQIIPGPRRRAPRSQAQGRRTIHAKGPIGAA